MTSMAAQNVAKEVLETIGKGEIPSVNKIAPKHGYSKNTAHAGLVQKTKSYQAVISPVVTAMEKERDAVIKRMRKTRSKAKYRDLVDSLDKLTKNIQLLSGGATENVKYEADIKVLQSIIAQIR